MIHCKIIRWNPIDKIHVLSNWIFCAKKKWQLSVKRRDINVIPNCGEIFHDWSKQELLAKILFSYWLYREEDNWYSTGGLHMYIILVTVAELCICGVIYDQATNNNQADQTHHTHVFGDPNSGIFATFFVCY